MAPISADGVDLNDFMEVYLANPMSAERILTLAAGEVQVSSKWHDPLQMESMRLCEAEVVRRSTITQDPEAAQIRTQRFSNLRTIAELRQGKFKWPTEFSFLSRGFRFRWDPQTPSRNVATTERRLATIVFAGMFHSIEALERMDFRLRRALAGPAPAPNQILEKDELKIHEASHFDEFQHLCILYSTANQGIKVYQEKGKTAVTALSKRSSVDFSNPSGNRIYQKGGKDAT